MKRENDGLQQNEEKTNYFVGPLNLDRITRKAATAMGTQLELSENEFDALDLLAMKEGQYMTLRQIYETTWGESNSRVNEIITLATLESLMNKISIAGGEFLWIEHVPELGYTLKTRWGNNWQKKSIIKVYIPRNAEIPVATHTKMKRKIKPQLIATLAGALVIVIAIITMSFLG